MLSTWKLSQNIKNNSYDIYMVKKLKEDFGISLQRKIRFADSSDVEDLIVFEVEPTNNNNINLELEKNNIGLLLISIAPDNIIEYDICPLKETMDIKTMWI